MQKPQRSPGLQQMLLKALTVNNDRSCIVTALNASRVLLSERRQASGCKLASRCRCKAGICKSEGCRHLPEAVGRAKCGKLPLHYREALQRNGIHSRLQPVDGERPVRVRLQDVITPLESRLPAGVGHTERKRKLCTCCICFPCSHAAHHISRLAGLLTKDRHSYLTVLPLMHMTRCFKTVHDISLKRKDHLP